MPLEEGQGRGRGLRGPGPPGGCPRRAASARASIRARQSRSDVARSGGAGRRGLGTRGIWGGGDGRGGPASRLSCCPRRPREGPCPGLLCSACRSPAPSGSACSPAQRREMPTPAPAPQARPAGRGVTSRRPLSICVVFPLLSFSSPHPPPSRS